jgi:hypothetical protein
MRELADPVILKESDDEKVRIREGVKRQWI